MGLFSKLWKKIKGWLIPEVEGPQKGYDIEKKGTNEAIPVIYGRYPKAPCIKVYKMSSDKKGGAKNEYLHLICVIAEGEIGEFGDVYFDGVSEQAIDNDHYYIEKYTGSDTQAHSAQLTAQLAQWKSTAKLSGIAYLYVRLRQNKKVSWWRGEPKITVDINQGKLVLDPRDNQIKYSNNIALCTYDYLRSERYGKGLLANELVTQSFIDEANYTETNTTYTRKSWVTRWNPSTGEWERTASGSETETISTSLFSCNAKIDTDKEIKANVDILRKGARAILPQSNGKYRYSIEKEATPVYAFTKDNLSGAVISDGGNQSDRYNRVIIKYRNHLTGAMDEATYPESDELHQTWLEEDNGKFLLGEFTIETIDNKAEAIQMGHVIAQRSRQDVRAQWIGFPDSIEVEVGDVVTIDSQINGWNAKPFRVETVDIDLDTGLVKFQGIEHQNTIYPWSVTETTEEYADTSFHLPGEIGPPTGLQFSNADDTSEILGVLQWADPNDVMVTGHIIEVVNTDTGGIVFSQDTTLNRIDIPRLEKGSYVASVAAKNSLFISTSSKITLTANEPRVPNGLVVNAGNFELILTPTIDGAPGLLLFDLKVSADTDINNSTVLGRARSFVDNDLAPNTERYYWARSVNATAESAWSEMFTGKTTNDNTNIIGLIGELGPTHLTPEIRSLLNQVEQATAEYDLDESISSLKANITKIEHVESGLIDDYQDTLLSAIDGMQQTALRDLNLATFRNEIQGWKLEVDSDLQSLVLQGGTVTESMWSAYTLKVDAATGTLQSLSAKQIEQDGFNRTNSTFIEQTSERLSLIEENTNVGDLSARFSQLQLQLDSQSNTISQQSSALFDEQLSTINSFLEQSISDFEAQEFNIDLAFVRKEIKTISDESKSLAQSNELLIAAKDDAEARIHQQSIALAQTNKAQVEDRRSLSVSIKNQGKEFNSEIERLDQANVSQDAATASSIATINSQITNDKAEFNSEIERLDQANVSQDAATASSIATINSQITNDKAEFNSEIERLDQANVSQDAATASSIATINSQITSDKVEVEAQIARLDQVNLTQDSANAASINGLATQINDPINGLLSAHSQIAQINKVDLSSTSPLVQSFLNLKSEVEDPSTGLAKAFVTLGSQSNDIDGLMAQFVIGTDVNGRFSGIYSNNTLQGSNLAFSSDEVSFVNPITGLNDIEYSAFAKRLMVHCDLVGAGGTFNGLATGSLNTKSARIQTDINKFAPFVIHQVAQVRGGDSSTTLIVTFPQMKGPLYGAGYSAVRFGHFKQDINIEAFPVTRSTKHGSLWVDVYISYNGGAWVKKGRQTFTPSLSYDFGTVPFFMRYTTRVTSWSTIQIQLRCGSNTSSDSPLSLSAKVDIPNYDESGYGSESWSGDTTDDDDFIEPVGPGGGTFNP